MKLGEALTERKRLQELIPTLSTALQAVITEETGQPANTARTPATVLKEKLAQAIEDLGKIIVNINHTNNQTPTESYKSVMEAIASRESLMLQTAHLKAVIGAIRPRRERGYNQGEVREYVVAQGIHPAGIRQEYDHSAAHLRKLTAELQTVNWTVDLIEL